MKHGDRIGRRKQFHFGEAKRHDAVICAAGMKISRVKYGGGGALASPGHDFFLGPVLT